MYALQLNVLDDLAEAMKALDGKKKVIPVVGLLRWYSLLQITSKCISVQIEHNSVGCHG